MARNRVVLVPRKQLPPFVIQDGKLYCFDVTESLRQQLYFLGIPDDAVILSSSEHAFFDRDAIAFLIEHPSFDDVPDPFALPALETLVTEAPLSPAPELTWRDRPPLL